MLGFSNLELVQDLLANKAKIVDIILNEQQGDGLVTMATTATGMSHGTFKCQCIVIILIIGKLEEGPPPTHSKVPIVGCQVSIKVS